MKKLWNKIKAHFSGWPESVSDENKKREEEIDKSVKESQVRKAKAKKKPTAKGLKTKKKKKQSK